MKAKFPGADIPNHATIASRMDEIEKWPFSKAMMAHGRMLDVAIALEKLNNER